MRKKKRKKVVGVTLKMRKKKRGDTCHWGEKLYHSLSKINTSAHARKMDTNSLQFKLTK